MKKLMIILGLILLVGCSNNVNLDLDNIQKKIDVTGLFKGTQVDLEYVVSKYGLEKEGIEDYSINMSNMLDSASMYAIFKVSDVKSVKANTDNFIDKYASSWMMGYNLEQEAIVQDKMEEVYGNYIIYVISNDNEKVLNIIKE